MLQSKARLVTALLATVFAGAPLLHAQATSTVSRPLDISAFAGATGTFTGLDSGKNVAITAGLDAGPARQYFGVRLAAEVRGTYDIDDGTYGGERSVLGGIRVEKPLRWMDGRLTPSVDLLAGRGEFKFADPGRLNYLGTLLYHQYAGTVISPGAGFTYDVFNSWAFHADAQFQRWDTLAVTDTHPHSIATTFGVTYRLGRGERRVTRYRR